MIQVIEAKKMANPKPKIENLEKGRGKKPKLGHKSFTVKLSPWEKENLDEVAKSFGCKYGEGASLSGLLSKIANEELIVVQAPPSRKHIYFNMDSQSSKFQNSEEVLKSDSKQKFDRLLSKVNPEKSQNNFQI